ncbi:MAG: hypothetical protein E6H53_03330 [Betaproteobacteria bacterium]|nr:MAG: hypothetical protein E6H53_03330 [Betaproteobacteria bacterium]
MRPVLPPALPSRRRAGRAGESFPPASARPCRATCVAIATWYRHSTPSRRGQTPAFPLCRCRSSAPRTAGDCWQWPDEPRPGSHR